MVVLKANFDPPGVPVSSARWINHCGMTQSLAQSPAHTWEKQVLSARGFKRVGRHSEYAL